MLRQLRACKQGVCTNLQVWERSPLARERSLAGYWDEADDSQDMRAAVAENAAARAAADPSSSGRAAPPGSNGGAPPVFLAGRSPGAACLSGCGASVRHPRPASE